MGERDYVYVLQCDKDHDNEIQQMAAAQKEVVERYRQVQAMRASNHYLEGVLADYRRYFDHIRDEKRRQYEAMRGLNDYIERMRSEIDGASHVLRATAHDQKELLSEIANVKHQIDHEIPKANFEA